MQKHLVTISALTLAGSTGTAEAASLTYDFDSFAYAEDRLTGGAEVADEDPLFGTTITLDGSFVRQSTASYEFATGSGRLEVDPTAGTVKFGTRAEARYDLEDELNNAARGFGDFSLSETFSVSGSGSVTFSVAVDGFLEKSFGFGGLSASTEGVLRLASANRYNADVIDFFSRTLGTTLGGTSIVDEVLTATIEMFDGETLEFTYSADATTFANANEYRPDVFAESNFLNTARISFFTDDGVSLTPSDPAFLSDVGLDEPIGAVPLPAGLPLLLAGLGALGFASRRRC